MPSTTSTQRKSETSTPSRGFRFSFAWMLILTAASALISLGIKEYLNRLPPYYQTYTRELLDSKLNHGKAVMVVAYGDWSINTSNPMRWVSGEVTRKIRDRGVVLLEAEWTNESHGTMQELLDSLGVSSVPLIAIYKPSDPHNPFVIRDLPDEDLVIRAIDLATGL